MSDRIHLESRIRQLVAQHGSLRAVSRKTNIDVAYLHRLLSGQKTNPSDDVLARLGLQRVSYYTTLETREVKQSGGA